VVVVVVVAVVVIVVGFGVRDSAFLVAVIVLSRFLLRLV